MKLTKWFPASVKPVRAGVYEVDTPECLGNRYSYWNGSCFEICTAHCGLPKNRCESWDMRAINARWRGLASNPQKVTK